MDFKDKANEANRKYRATGLYQFIEKSNALVYGGILAFIVGLFSKRKK